MRQPVFIRLENTFEAAMYYENSPQMNVYSFNGIRLLPNTDNAYTQRTYAAGGIELEDFTVSLFTLCGGSETPLDTNLFSITPFQDPDDGTNQLYWSFKPDATDLGLTMVYLRFKQGNDYIYSSPFQLTADNSEYTTRFDYWDETNDTVLSTQLNFYYIQPFTALTIDEYVPLYTSDAYKSIVSSNIKYKRYRFGIVFIDLFLQFADMMENAFVYLNYQRCNLYKAFEIPELQGFENFGEMIVDLYVDKYDTYDPNYIPYVPPAPPVDRQIILDAVDGQSGNVVTYTHHEIGFEPSYLTYQRSLDQITWEPGQNTQGAESPKDIPGINWSGNNYYYRIAYQDIVSNVLQIQARTIVITNMESSESTFKTGTPIRYRIYYDINNFTTLANTQMTVEYSVDGITYGNLNVPLVAPQTGSNSFTFTAPATAQQFTKFRLTYATFGITSEPYTFELP